MIDIQRYRDRAEDARKRGLSITIGQEELAEILDALEMAESFRHNAAHAAKLDSEEIQRLRDENALLRRNWQERHLIDALARKP